MKIRFLIWGILFLVCSSLILAFATAKKVRTPQTTEISPEEFGKEVKEQVASYTAYNAPFFFPFHARPTHTTILNPFTRRFGYAERINSQGFRTPEYTTAHPPNTFRILVLGDSITYGTNVVLEETYPYIMSRLLRNKCGNTRVEVISLGVYRHRLPDNLIKLMVHGSTLNPDLVIVQFAPDDLDISDYAGALRYHHVPHPYAVYLEKESQVYSEESTDWKVFSEALDEFQNWSESRSIPVVFAVFPIIDSERNGHNFDHYQASYLQMNPHFSQMDKVVDAMRKRSFPTLNLLKDFKSAGDAYLSVSETINDLNPFAQQIAAQSIANFLDKQELLACRRKPAQPAGSEYEKESVIRKDAADNWADLNSSLRKQAEFYESLQKIYPKDAWIASQLGNIYLSQKKYRAATLAYVSLTKLAPRYAAPWFYLGTIAGTDNERISQLESALKFMPDNTQAMEVLSQAYFSKQRKEDGCRLIRRIIDFPEYEQGYDQANEIFKQRDCTQIMTAAKTDVMKR